MALRIARGTSRTCAIGMSKVPTRLKPGEELYATLENEEIVFVGAYPSGIPVLLLSHDWQALCRWKLSKLSTASGRVFACGGTVNQLADRFLMGVECKPMKVVKHRNGNSFDLRRSNLVVVSYYQAAKEKQKARIVSKG